MRKKKLPYEGIFESILIIDFQFNFLLENLNLDIYRKPHSIWKLGTVRIVLIQRNRSTRLFGSTEKSNRFEILGSMFLQSQSAPQTDSSIISVNAPNTEWTQQNSDPSWISYLHASTRIDQDSSYRCLVSLRWYWTTYVSNLEKYLSSAASPRQALQDVDYLQP